MTNGMCTYEDIFVSIDSVQVPNPNKYPVFNIVVEKSEPI